MRGACRGDRGAGVRASPRASSAVGTSSASAWARKVLRGMWSAASTRLTPVERGVVLADELEVDPRWLGAPCARAGASLCSRPRGSASVTCEAAPVNVMSIVSAAPSCSVSWVGPRPADLVFAPTPACRSLRRRRSGEPSTPALSRPDRGQDLHLNRAMLSDQRSPYVGRFARGWHRLPGIIPGQPQTRTRARPSIGTRPRDAGGTPARRRRRCTSRAPARPALRRTPRPWRRS